MGYLEDWLLPNRSVLSGLPAQDLDLTKAEFNALVRLPKVCPVCAEPTPDDNICGDCLLHPKAFDVSRCGFLYEPPISHWLQQLKYQGELYAGRLLAELFVRQWHASYSEQVVSYQGQDQLAADQTEGKAEVKAEDQAIDQIVDASVENSAYQPIDKPVLVDCLLPVPLHLARFRHRGFNQSEVLAQHLGRAFSLPVELRALQRIVDTPSQTQLDRSQRSQNVRGAFAVDRLALQGIKRVALVDDVLTTGSTANEIARLIKQQTTVEWVEVWTIAKRL